MRKLTLLIPLLLLVPACGGDDGGPSGPSGPTTGSIQVSLVVSGFDMDADGCTFTLDGAGQRRLTAGGSTTYADLSVGQHTVAISDVADNCQVQGEVSRQVSVTADRTTSVSFSVTCASRVGSIAVSVATTGGDLDQDGYAVIVEGETPVAVGINETATVGDLSPGEHTVGLEGVAANCTVTGDNPRSVTVVAGQVSQETFPIDCDWRTRIAFHSLREGELEVYVMNPDGTEQTNLTRQPSADGYPSWSPAGRRIAFTSRRDGDWEVYVMNADGTDQINLTNHPDGDGMTTWSPDGTRIAFESWRDGDSEIYMMNADGSGQVNLTNDPASDLFPSWSPDGTQIAFACWRDANWEICIMNVDGTGQVNLTNSPSVEQVPRWSPDGTRIVFESDRDGDMELYVMNADGTDQVNLTNHPELDRYPSWSPNLYED